MEEGAHNLREVDLLLLLLLLLFLPYFAFNYLSFILFDNYISSR